jgi:hypothetical protein
VTTHLVDKCQIAGTIAGFDIMCATHDQKLQQCIDHNWVAHAEDIKEIDANRRCIAQAGADLTRLRQLDDQSVIKLADSEQRRKELWEVNVRLTSEKRNLELEVRKASADAHLQWEGKVNNGSLANKAIRDSARYKARIERLQSMLGAMAVRCEPRKQAVLLSRMPGKATLVDAERWKRIEPALNLLWKCLHDLQPLRVLGMDESHWIEHAIHVIMSLGGDVQKAMAQAEHNHEQAVAMSEQVQEMQAKLAARNRTMRGVLERIKFQFTADGLWLRVAGAPESGSIKLWPVNLCIVAIEKWQKDREEALRG